VKKIRNWKQANRRCNYCCTATPSSPIPSESFGFESSWIAGKSI